MKRSAGRGPARMLESSSLGTVALREPEGRLLDLRQSTEGAAELSVC
jgi:hypothetical protein